MPTPVRYGSYVALRVRGRYVSDRIDDHHFLRASASEAQEWETFRVLPPGDERDLLGRPLQSGSPVVLRAFTKFYACVDSHSNDELHAWAVNAQAWETLRVTLLDGQNIIRYGDRVALQDYRGYYITCDCGPQAGMFGGRCTEVGEWETFTFVECAQPTDELEQVIAVLRKVPAVAGHMQHNRPPNRQPFVVENERDLQYLLHALLIAQFDDVQPEDPVPAYAGAGARVDFVLRRERVLVETKVATERHTQAQIRNELIVDVEQYRNRHPDCGSIACLVYDPDRHIDNRAGFESDLSRTYDEVTVRVVVVP